jgi:transketolase
VATRFIGHGWNVTRVGDANDLQMLARAFRTFLNTRDRPTLIIVDSHIAYGVPEGWDRDIPTFAADAKGLATRDASGKVLNVIGKNVPWLMGGSADLGPSCKTRLTFDGAGDFSADSPGGRNLHFGIREDGRAAVLNGMALVKVRAYGIVAELPWQDRDKFWTAEPHARSRILELFAAAGAKVVVAEEVPGHISAAGWQRVGDAGHYAFLLPR